MRWGLLVLTLLVLGLVSRSASADMSRPEEDNEIDDEWQENQEAAPQKAPANRDRERPPSKALPDVTSHSPSHGSDYEPELRASTKHRNRHSTERQADAATTDIYDDGFEEMDMSLPVQSQGSGPGSGRGKQEKQDLIKQCPHGGRVPASRIDDGGRRASRYSYNQMVSRTSSVSGGDQWRQRSRGDRTTIHVHLHSGAKSTVSRTPGAAHVSILVNTQQQRDHGRTPHITIHRDRKKNASKSKADTTMQTSTQPQKNDKEKLDFQAAASTAPAADDSLVVEDENKDEDENSKSKDEQDHKEDDKHEVASTVSKAGPQDTHDVASTVSKAGRSLLEHTDYYNPNMYDYSSRVCRERCLPCGYTIHTAVNYAGFNDCDCNSAFSRARLDMFTVLLVVFLSVMAMFQT